MRRSIRSERLDLTDLLPISDLMLQRGIFRFRVAGWSMYPTLRKGDALTVEPASPASLQMGDLILFHHLGQLICHRLVAMQETEAGPRLITKGDAATGCDAPLQPDQVLGRVVGVRPSWHWAGFLSKRIDCWLARLRDEVAQRLLALQGLRSYRGMMRALLSWCFSYDVGIAWGSRWYQDQTVHSLEDPGALTEHARFHDLLLRSNAFRFRAVTKLAGCFVGSVHVEARDDGYWVEDLSVRIRFRGMGVASQLLALAASAAAASRNKPSGLLAAVEPANTATLHLLTKAGFRKTGGLSGNHVSLRRDL